MTAEAVWEALAEIPDPEIPVISLVDLGVVKDVAVDAGTARVEFTPTFMGCPALEVMRHAMEQKIGELGLDAEITVRLGRLVVDGRHHRRRPREAPRCRFRAARTAGRGEARPRPAPARLPLSVLRLDGDEARKSLRPHAVLLDPLPRELPPAVEQFKTI